MKENLNKFLSKTLILYYFLLVIIVIMKLIGFEWFALDTDNEVLITINDIFVKYHLTDVYMMISLYIQGYIIFALTLKDNSKKLMKVSILPTILVIFSQFFLNYLDFESIYPIINILIMIVFIKIYSKEFKVIRFCKIFLLNMLYQSVSIFFRNVNSIAVYNFIENTILNFDYMILLIITYKLYFEEGGKIICSQEVGSFSQKQSSLTNLFQKYQIKSLNSKEKFELILSFTLTLFWNCFTVLVVLIIAFLNNTIIECVFILISFWSSKLCFGKPFHFKSVIQCFIVSNLTYYALNRITLPIGVSIIIPIVLGVGLSYFTAIKTKSDNKLYKGMSEESLYEILKKVTDDPIVIKICKEFYCDRYSDAKISLINSYSVASVRLKRQTINKKLKELNK